jgi:hypothetical protein
MENKLPNKTVAPQRPVATPKQVAAGEAVKAAALTNPLPPTTVESKKGYNLFKNPQGKWELQVDNGRGRIGKTIFEKEEDAKETIAFLKLDKK